MLQLTGRDRHIIESHEQYCFTITGLYHLLSNSDLHQPFSEVKIPSTSYRNLPQSCCRKMDLTQIKKKKSKQVLRSQGAVLIIYLKVMLSTG